MRGILHAIGLTAYNVFLIKAYLDTFLESHKWKRGIIGWGLFILWEIGRIMQVLHVGRSGILTYQNPGWNLFINIIVLAAIGLFSYTGEIGKRILFPIIYVALLMFVEAFVVFGMECIDTEGVSVIIYFLLSNITMLMLVMGIKYFAKKNSLDFIGHFERRSLFLFVVGGIALYYSFYRLVRDSGTNRTEPFLWLFISALILLVLELCIYPIYGKLAEAVWTKRNICDYKKQIELYKNQRELEKVQGKKLRGSSMT